MMNESSIERVLVTGATGFVGAHVARRLIAEGYRVCALCRATSRRELLEGAPVEWRLGDLRDARSLVSAMDGCTALFHVAADYRLSAVHPEELYESNVEGTRNILEAARNAGVRRSVYTSTVGAIGIPKEGGAGSEETPVAPDAMVGAYKRSKYLAERLVVDAASNGMDVVIVNPSTPVGEGDVKPTPTGKMIVDFLNGRMPAYLDTGLNLVAVRDVAEGHLLAFKNGERGKRYILGSRNMTLHQILEMLAEITGLPAPQIRVPYFLAYGVALLGTLSARVSNQPPAIPIEAVKLAHSHMFFDSSRAVYELGLRQTSVSAALLEAVQWFLSHGYVTHPARAAALQRRVATEGEPQIAPHER